MKRKVFLFLTILALCAAGFAAADTLPAYAYTGNDPVEAAVAAFTADLGSMYMTGENSVTVPAPVILKTEKTGDGQMKVYGNFWVFNYVQKEDVLECISGGEAPGVLTLVRDGEKWVPASFEGVGDGEEYKTDILLICGDDKELADGYFAASDSSGELFRKARFTYLREYVTANGLKVTAIQDPGWDPEDIFGEAEDVLSLLKGQSLNFYSGAGGWETSLTFGENGAFEGKFHDGEMGETGEGYPDGTVYTCLFHGRLSAAEQLTETSWLLKVEENAVNEGQEAELIGDGIRFVTGEPYGLCKATEVVLYLPGTPVKDLPEGFLFWAHLDEIDPEAKTLPYYAIWNEAEEAGFVGSPVE
ncbi:MAG: hypothetical protein IKI84_11165 [Clostridia bacterium]|nr:hypothetical protein [Clostridia bacterium]